MAHYAILDEDDMVIEVITGVDEDDLDTLPDEYDDWESFYSSIKDNNKVCLLYTSPSPRDYAASRMPSSA